MARDMVQVRSPGHGSRYQAPSMRLGRSQFNIGRRHKTTFDAGYLIPYLVEEVLPGDTFTCKLRSFLRIFSPLDAPIMDDIHVSIDYFFVPNRLVWDNWEDFLGAHDAAGAQDTDFTIPVIGTGLTLNVLGAVGDYFGIPFGLSTSAESVNALPFRGFRLIYNEWYRDQNVVDPISLATDNGPDTNAESGFASLPPKSAKKHDYFTSALPYLQKGDAQNVLLSGQLPVRTDAADNAVLSILGSDPTYTRMDADVGVTDEILHKAVSTSSGNRLYTDLADATAAFSINALREAAAIQRLLERDARGGTRHPEIIRAHFGVDVPDYRTQRPEYLGGGSGYINVSPVANTSATATENQGELAGVGTGQLSAAWAKSFVEHGYVLGILRARGELSYSQGLHRMWSRSTKYDFMWPELAHLGEQEILNKELFIAGDATDDDVFGYQERYAEYRYGKSLITGKFAPDATGSLDFWHLSEDFGSAPALNQTFIEDQTPMSRVTTVDSEPDFIIDGYHDIRVARALPVRPVPSLAPARF